MLRKAFTMRIFPGQEEEYQRRHNPIWPELEQTLRDHGVHNYSIFRQGLTLFAYCEIEDEARWNSIAQTEICKKWWVSMAPLMESNPDSSPVAQMIDEMFHMD